MYQTNFNETRGYCIGVFLSGLLGAGALGRPRGMEWGGRREEGSGWGKKKKKNETRGLLLFAVINVFVPSA